MRVSLLGAVALLAVAPSLSFAQMPPPADQGPAMRQDSRPKRAANPRRDECRQSGTARGMRGPDLSSHIQICMQEARLSCMRQAADRRLAGRDRRDFIKQCQTS